MLPWASVMISETLVAADRGREFVCARGVDKSTSRGVGTSVIARTLNACVCSGAGRRPSGKPDAVRMKRSKSSTPRLSVRTVSVPYLRRNHPSLSKLRQRMVTQQKFLPLFCATGQGAMRRPQSWVATSQATAVPPAARRFAGYSIVNASGNSAALSGVSKRTSRSIRPPGRDVAPGNTTLPA